jgi:hypothetical protein
MTPEDASAGPAGAAGGVSVGVRVHRVAYDLDAVAERMIAAGLPPTLLEALRNA